MGSLTSLLGSGRLARVRDWSGVAPAVVPEPLRRDQVRDGYTYWVVIMIAERTYIERPRPPTMLQTPRRVPI
jgi:hypothetical protein